MDKKFRENIETLKIKNQAEVLGMKNSIKRIE
jgi:hypothetical protein